MAAQAPGEATIMSCPRALRGEVAGRSMRGVAPALAEGGKVLTRERAVGVDRETVALHSRAGVAGVGEAVHVPAVAGVVEALDQQAQALQPGVCMALAVQQQQPERQSVEAQSKLEAQASPGEKVAQEPVPGAQALQPRRVAAVLQQKPPRQAPDVQEELEVQVEPLSGDALASLEIPALQR